MDTAILNINLNDEKFKLRLSYLAIYNEEPSELKGLQHLQALRVGISQGYIEESYNQLEPKLISLLANELSNMNFDYIIAPPSNYPYARKYVDELTKAKKNVINLSDHIIPNNRRKRATSGASVDELVLSWECDRSFGIAPASTILLVDDIVNSGSTFGALIKLLSQGKLNQSLSFHAVAPLWIKNVNK